MSIPPFHLAFPVHDLAAARQFYGELLQCPEGRSDDHWIDFDFYGHQIVTHLVPAAEAVDPHHNPVDGQAVPVPHFGVVLPWSDWETLADRLKQADVTFVIEPYVRFAGLPGEQATMFLLDPSGNSLEFKSFRDLDNLFRKQ
jgi:uncharacterized protein